MMIEQFKQAYKEFLNEILVSSTGENSPYKASIDYINSEFEKYNIEHRQRISVLSGLMRDVSVNLTNNAMNVALNLTAKALSFNDELENLKIKNQLEKEQMPLKIQALQAQLELTKAQTQKVQSEINLANSQQNAIDRQVKDNRVIKVSDSVGRFLSESQAGGLNAPTGMLKWYFDLNYELIKNDITISRNTDLTMKKR